MLLEKHVEILLIWASNELFAYRADVIEGLIVKVLHFLKLGDARFARLFHIEVNKIEIVFKGRIK